MKGKWFLMTACVAMVVGLVVGCSEEAKKPTEPKPAQQEEEIPFEEGGVKGATYSGSHDYGRARLDELVNLSRIAPLMSRLRDVGYETAWDRSMLIEGRADGVNASVAYVLSRSMTRDEWAVVTIVDSKGEYTFNAALYWESYPPAHRGATEVSSGLWAAPIETVIGPEAKRQGGTRRNGMITTYVSPE